MADHQYSYRELELLFKRIEEKLDDIKDDIKNTNTHFDVRLNSLDKRVTKLEGFQTKAMTVWALVVTLVGFVINRIL
jgi:hypothetical protein